VLPVGDVLQPGGESPEASTSRSDGCSVRSTLAPERPSAAVVRREGSGILRKNNLAARHTTLMINAQVAGRQGLDAPFHHATIQQTVAGRGRAALGCCNLGVARSGIHARLSRMLARLLRGNLGCRDGNRTHLGHRIPR